jgi:uncharacterized lipoprotein YddW (UPF0748 family)
MHAAADAIEGWSKPMGWHRLAWMLLAALVTLAPVAPASAQIGLPKPKPKEETGPTIEVKPRPGEVRATFLRPDDGDALSPAKIAETMKRLRDLGMNAVYVTAWDQGYPNFPSGVMQKTTSVSISPTLAGGRDLLGEALAHAHRNGMLLIANFDGGLAASPATADHALRKTKPEWLLKDARGGTAGAGHAWLNPLVPEARTFITELIIEAIDRYDLDGIHLSERFFWPDATLGYDEATRVLYAKETGGQALPADPRDPGFVRWRAAKSVALLRELAGAIKNKRPGLIVSLAAPTDKPTIDSGLADWPAIVRLNVMDEFVVQCHRADFATFQPAWADAMKAMGGRRAECVVSIRAAGGGAGSGGLPDQPWPEVKKALDWVRETKAAGIAFSSSRAPLFTHSAALLDYYAVARQGRERHTLRGLEWRPGPLQPERMNYRGEFLVVRGLPSGVYRAVIVGANGGPTVECSVRVAEGAARLTKEAAAALQGGGVVEFLVDRRGENAQPIPDPSLPPPSPSAPPAPRPKKSDTPKPPGGG